MSRFCLQVLLTLKSCALLQVLSVLLAHHVSPTPRKKKLGCSHIRSYLNPKGFQPYKGLHAYNNGSIIKLVASSRNSTSRRTMPKVQDHFQENHDIKNEASTFCKMEILCTRLRALWKRPSFVKKHSFDVMKKRDSFFPICFPKHDVKFQ